MKQCEKLTPSPIKALDEGRTAQWWRNPYCWLILVGPITVVIAGILTAWIAIDGADPLVDANYYQKGIALSKGVTDTPGSLLPAKQARNHAATGGSPAGLKPVDQ